MRLLAHNFRMSARAKQCPQRTRLVPEVRMRKHLAPVVIFAAAVACTGESRNPVGLALPETVTAIADATSGGREGFYFLQPIVANPKVTGPFDATLVPRARVCALDASRTACSAVILATIPTGSGPG